MMQMMKAGFTAQGGHNIMNKQDRKLIEKMMEYYAGDPKRVQHFLKVYEFAKLIGESEELEPESCIFSEPQRLFMILELK